MDSIWRVGAASPEPASTNATRSASEDHALRQASREFEAVFLAEMLKHSGLGGARETFGGGVGEAAFSSMMTQEWARSLTNRGGIGITDHLYNAIKQSGDGYV